MPGAPDPTQTAAELILEQERAQAEVDRYKIAFTNLQKQKNQLQTTLDILTSANGLYAGVSDDLHFTINQFDTRLSDLQNQINITNRRTPPPTWGPWLDMFLNVALVFALLYAIYAVASKAFVHPYPQQVVYPY